MNTLHEGVGCHHDLFVWWNIQHSAIITNADYAGGLTAPIDTIDAFMQLPDQVKL
jgi:hypothetical protein